MVINTDMCFYKYVYIYIYIHIKYRMYIWILFICVYTCIYIYLYVNILYIHTCTYISIYICSLAASSPSASASFGARSGSSTDRTAPSWKKRINSFSAFRSLNHDLVFWGSRSCGPSSASLFRSLSSLSPASSYVYIYIYIHIHIYI